MQRNDRAAERRQPMTYSETNCSFHACLPPGGSYHRACAVGRTRISLRLTRRGRETAKAMISAMSAAVIALILIRAHGQLLGVEVSCPPYEGLTLPLPTGSMRLGIV